MNHSLKALALVVIGMAALPVTAAELVFSSWGGSYQDAQNATAVRPFASQSGTNVKTDTYNGGIAQIRSQVETKNVTWDVVDMQLADATRACDEGLLEKINPASLPAATTGTAAKSDFMPGGLSDCLVGNVAWSTVITYNKNAFKGGEPTKIADFFDLKRFPGKRGLRKSPEAALEWALLADGVPAADVYKTLATPDGLKRAFRKLDTIKSSIVWWETGAQPPQLLADGEVTMTSAYNNRIYVAATQDKKPFGFLWDGEVKNIEGYAIVKGSKNQKAAQDFIRHATSTEALAKLASATALGPLRQSSVKLVDPKVAPFLPTAPQNQKNAIDTNIAFWADHSDDLNQKFAVWLGQK
ncbi:polyamine ABC transporter substrate-binding protein [Burkholderia ambifaria]|uniref:polyamine ABC transporter substrate-binding protein n=1 Tax=Burkholderia ambifaria TaxID=152480 RepID=UPI001BA14E99|nr:ABC transporter substrate-binding protein [Burkholderia ambifaria]MBR8220736.1 polyamine ABC transporter substrate-binding protein [Burkholderia ambifaria]